MLFVQVKMCHLPALPRHKELVSELGPIHARLSSESLIAKRHPIYRCNEVQVIMICHAQTSNVSLLSLIVFLVRHFISCIRRHRGNTFFMIKNLVKL